MRRGDVYVCDVVDRAGVGQRFIIDARTGNVMERYRTHGEASREKRAQVDWRERATNAWGYPPRPLIKRPHIAPFAAAQDDDEYSDAPIRRRPSPGRLRAWMRRTRCRGRAPYDLKNSANAEKAKPKAKAAKKKATPESTPEPTTASVAPECRDSPLGRRRADAWSDEYPQTPADDRPGPRRYAGRGADAGTQFQAGEPAEAAPGRRRA